MRHLSLLLTNRVLLLYLNRKIRETQNIIRVQKSLEFVTFLTNFIKTASNIETKFLLIQTFDD